MIDYIINILKGIFNNEGIRTEPEPEPKKKKEAKKPKGLNPKKTKKKGKKQGNSA